MQKHELTPEYLVVQEPAADARQKGAKVLTGGKRTQVGGRGYYFEPTVIVDVDHSMAVMTEESFGPIIGIQKVEHDREAIQLMNDTRYGLTSSIFTHDANRAREVLRRIQSGTVYWNCCDRVSPRLPWSGRGDSGVGVTLGEEGIRSFVRPKAWHWRTP